MKSNKEKSQDEFKVLVKINNNPYFSQRNLAKTNGFSLGKLNYCLKSLIKKGYIKMNNFKKNKNKIAYGYLLTPKGISYKTKMAYYFMKQKLEEYEELKKEINEENKE